MRVLLIAGGEHGIIADIVSRRPHSATVVNKNSTTLKEVLPLLDEGQGALAHDFVLITDGGLSANPEENELYIEKLIGATKARVSIVTRDFLFGCDLKNVKVVCQRWFCVEKSEIGAAFAESASDSRNDKGGEKTKKRSWVGKKSKPSADEETEDENVLERVAIDRTSRAVIFTGHRGAGVTSTAVGVALSAVNRGLRTIFVDFDTEYRAANLYFGDFNSQADDSEEVASSLIRVLARPQSVDTAAVNSGGAWVTSLSYGFEDNQLMKQHFTTAKIVGMITALKHSFDIVIVDFPLDILAEHASVLNNADAIALCMENNLYSAFTTLRNMAVRFEDGYSISLLASKAKLVATRYNNVSEWDDEVITAERLSEIIVNEGFCEDFTVEMPVAGAIPYHNKFDKQIENDVPIIETDSAMKKAYDSVLLRLVGAN